jgi:predicted CxxxxCH...CXXCH cytochrome family protein
VTLTANLVSAAPGVTGTNTVDTTGQTVTTAAGVGAHRAHLVGAGGTPRWRSAAIACTECHPLPPTNADVNHATGTGTGGARANVVFGALSVDTAFGARTPTYLGSTTGAGGTTGGTCASSYCHSPRADTVAGLNQTPSWTGATTTVACGSCHGLPPTAAAHPANTACGSCHPGYGNAPTSASTISAVNALVHINGSLEGGESSGGSPCLNCHKTDAATGAKYSMMVADTTVYHHVLSAETGTFQAYPLTNAGKACLNCHADHDVFNATLNPANTIGRGANLRTTIATAPTKVAPASGNYTNTDFSGTAGICLSCHSVAGGLVKSTTAQKTYAGAGNTITHVIDGTLYSASAHQYGVAGSFATGPSAISANCMKCHSDQQTATYPEKQSSTYEFALHTSVDRRLRNPMGQTTPVDDHAEDHCFRCHSTTTDVSPGAGPAKAVANRDYFNSVAMSAGAQDVFQAFTATNHLSKHNVGGYDFIHQPTEAAAGAGGTKHVECEDCHEPHATKAGAKPATNFNGVWGPITGVTGVVPTWSTANFTAPTAYAATTAATTEYQICFKCHSGANTGLATWGGTDWTDLALEFSPANKSRHPVASALNAAGSGTTVLAASQLVNGWAPGNVMTCSDCHGADAASPAAQGPHGSAVKYMLHGTNRAWPYTTAGATTGSLFLMNNTATNYNAANGNGLFCRNCHPDPAGGTGTTNAGHIEFNGRHSSNAISACIRCHLRVPHGGKVSRLIATSPNTPARYQVTGQTLNFVHFVKNNAGTYSGSSWFGTTCSTHSGGAATGEAW